MPWIRNVRGTSGRLCGCRTWLGHWRYETGSNRIECAVQGCSYDDLVGAHVQLTHGNATREVWIVPICNSCNQIPMSDELYPFGHARS